MMPAGAKQQLDDHRSWTVLPPPPLALPPGPCHQNPDGDGGAGPDSTASHYAVLGLPPFTSGEPLPRDLALNPTSAPHHH